VAARTSSGKAPARKKSAAKKTAAKKTGVGKKKTAGRKATAGRKYSQAAADDVRTELHEMHEGTLKSGRSGKKVTNPKQAIAIGLSEARRSGEKVPPNPKRSGGSS
jgi:hypothetical protein